MSTTLTDTDEVFLDTSVLVSFVQKASNSDCFPIFKDGKWQKTTSTAVREEYRRKRENREYIVKKFQEQIGRETCDFSDLNPPHQDHFTSSDRDYAKKLLKELASSSPEEANRELSRRRHLFKKGSKFLFDDKIGILDILSPDLDPFLIGNLRGIVDNRDDREIIAGAVFWAESRDKEVLLSEDRRDFINNKVMINEAISITPGFDCTLSIYTPARFLGENNP